MATSTIKDMTTTLGVMTIRPSANITRTSSGDATLTSYALIDSVGSGLTFDSTRGIVIGSGTNHVLVSATFRLNTTNNNHPLNMQIKINGATQDYASIDTTVPIAGNNFISSTPIVLSVSTGDYFQLGWYGVSGDTLKSATTLTVQVLD